MMPNTAETMSTAETEHTDVSKLSELIAESKRDTEEAKMQLLKTFQFVPDDKLHWSPSHTARTPLLIVAHCGAVNRVFAALLRGEPMPLPSDAKEAAAKVREGGKEIVTREAAIQHLEDSTAAVLSALDQVTPELVSTSPWSPFGSMPFAVWMKAPSAHMGGHGLQIDYLQTIWGDLEAH